jgi:hypothetical protein
MDAPHWIDILFNEYKIGNEGYNNRDSIIFQEFIGMATFFSLLIVIINYFRENDYIITLIGCFGFLFLLTMSIDIASTYSSKKIIRDYLSEIENEINCYYDHKDLLQLWKDKIPVRDTMYFLEKIKIPNLFPTCSVLLVLLWSFFIVFKFQNIFCLLFFIFIPFIFYLYRRYTKIDRTKAYGD